MITLKRSEERRHQRRGGLETWSSFEQPYPRAGFRLLQALHEQRLGPERSMDPQLGGHLDVVTYVCEGTLRQEDLSGRGVELVAGHFQRRGASPGAPVPFRNAGAAGHVHVIQLGIPPRGSRGKGILEVRLFPREDREGLLQLVVSPDGRRSSLEVDQDLFAYSSILEVGQDLVHEIPPGRGAWLQVLRGRVKAGGTDLHAGDGASFENEAAVPFSALEASEILLIDSA
jgi:redox-sensitive bicupin YhaK (pirin superfamily)